MKRVILLFLSAALLGSSPAFAERARMTAEEAYALGERYLKRGSYVKALEQFNRVRTYYRDDPYALKAELAIADLHFKKNEWDAARIAYEDFMRAHPRYRELDYVVYRLGETLYQKAPRVASRDQTWTRQAVNTWAGFPSRFPESAWRPEVEERLQKAKDRLARKEYVIAEFYAKREAWVAVVGRVEPMLRQYPDSPDRVAALGLLGLAYQGTGRDDLAHATLERLKTEAPRARATRKLAKALGDTSAAP